MFTITFFFCQVFKHFIFLGVQDFWSLFAKVDIHL